MHTELAASAPAASSRLLPEHLFKEVVANAPLVAIDLLVEDADRRILLGWRKNPPARDSWFVPGGRVRKDETLSAAFSRISEEELGQTFRLDQCVFVGVYQHFYPENFLGEHGASTHYLALAHRLWTGDLALRLPQNQHTQYRWDSPDSIAQDPMVHAYSRAYFLN
jgi:colanic acid biosynthesis protein WcaH